MRTSSLIGSFSNRKQRTAYDERGVGKNQVFIFSDNTKVPKTCKTLLLLDFQIISIKCNINALSDIKKIDDGRMHIFHYITLTKL